MWIFVANISYALMDRARTWTSACSFVLTNLSLALIPRAVVKGGRVRLIFIIALIYNQLGTRLAGERSVFIENIKRYLSSEFCSLERIIARDSFG